MFLNLLFYYELSELWGGATSICDGNFQFSFMFWCGKCEQIKQSEYNLEWSWGLKPIFCRDMYSPWPRSFSDVLFDAFVMCYLMHIKCLFSHPLMGALAYSSGSSWETGEGEGAYCFTISKSPETAISIKNSLFNNLKKSSNNKQIVHFTISKYF